MSAHAAAAVESDPVGRFGLLALLLFMVVGFGVVRALGAKRFDRAFARPLLYVYAVVAAAGLLLPSMAPDFSPILAVVRGALTGIASSFLLTAWGHAFEPIPTESSIPEAFVGSLVGALVCLVFSFAAFSPIALGAVCLLPVASVVNIPPGPNGSRANPSPARDDDSTQRLSIKILAGTALFGMAAGLMLLHRNTGGATANYQVSLVLYGAFLIGALTLLLSDGFGRGASLNKAYRVAVFIMVMGILLVPWPLLAESIMPGESVVLAGFLALEAVFISLFLVLAEITSADCAEAFSAGFLALFAGELAGACLAALLAHLLPGSPLTYELAVLAGAITLIGYIFLFTERDFDQLSQLVTESDSFEQVCDRITEQYGLSNREAEILAYALRGRTSERIAQELVISKSTVDTHLRRIYGKCGVHSRQELLDLAER